MFQENVEDVALATKAASIPTGDYEMAVGAVSTYKAQAPKSDSWIVTMVIEDGDYQGCEYTFFVTLGKDKKSAGFRSSFYRNIGYVMPEDGAVDENTWAGLKASGFISNMSGSDPKLMRVNKTKVETAPDANVPVTDVDFV